MKIKKTLSMLAAISLVAGCMVSFAGCDSKEEKSGSSSTSKIGRAHV